MCVCVCQQDSTPTVVPKATSFWHKDFPSRTDALHSDFYKIQPELFLLLFNAFVRFTDLCFSFSSLCSNF